VPDSDQTVSIDQPRYSTRAFPIYRFIPGQTPNPRRHPDGHSYGHQEPRPCAFPEDEWSASEDYLYAIDLYNFAYWWESHEVFEGLWHACGRSTQAGNFFQALIQLAAANLKQLLGRERAVRNLVARGLERLQKLPPHYMGVDTVTLTDDFKLWMNGHRDPQVLIHLRLPTSRRRS
jgi:hypothetical protein